MDNPRNIFLIGPTGAGKTTVGKILAEQLGLQFLDTDMEIEARSGVDVSWIFDIEGEEGFRDRETKTIYELTELNGVLIATGGGAILREENRKRLISRGTVIYLETPIERQLERTIKGKTRPLLRGDPEANRRTLETMHQERSALYQQTADAVFSADKRSARMLATEIVEFFTNQQQDKSWAPAR